MGSLPVYVPMQKPRPAGRPVQTTDMQVEDGRGGAGGILNFSIGGIVTQILGRKLVPDYNVIWAGNLKPLTQDTKKTESLFGYNPDGSSFTTTKEITVTETIGYVADLHIAICLGPDVKLMGIVADGSPIWSGEVGPARSTFTLRSSSDALSDCECVFSGGAYNQPPEPDIDVPDYPGYVGIATILIKEVRIDEEIPQISFDVMRVPNPLGLTSDVNTLNHDLNLMTILAEVMTNPWGYGNITLGEIDVDRLKTIAAVMKAEGQFGSSKLSSETTLHSLITAVQSQGNLVVFQHPQSHKIYVNYISPVINYATAMRLGQNAIIAVTDFAKAGWPSTMSQARGRYTERDADYNPVPVLAQNPATMAMSNKPRNSGTFEYPFVTNRALASKLTARDLAFNALPVVSFGLTTNRDGAYALPGETVLVSDPDFGMVGHPMVVNTIRKQPLDNNTVTLKLRQLKSADPNLIFTPNQGPSSGVVPRPLPPADVRIMSAPYMLTRSRPPTPAMALSATTSALLLPRAADEYQSQFSAAYLNHRNRRLNSEGGISYLEPSGAVSVYPTAAVLGTPIGRSEGITTGIIPEMVIDSVIIRDYFNDTGADGVEQMQNLIFVNDEIMAYETFEFDPGIADRVKLFNVHRGLLDTVAGSHAGGAKVYIIPESYKGVTNALPVPLGATLFPYGLAGNAEFRIMSATMFPSDTAYLDIAGGDPRMWTGVGVSREFAPYRPHNLMIDGEPRSITPLVLTLGDPVVLTWNTRNRVAPTVKSQVDAAEAPESGQTHRVYYRNSGGVATEVSGVTYGANTASFTLTGLATGNGSIFVASVRDGWLSRFHDELPVTIANP